MSSEAPANIVRSIARTRCGHLPDSRCASIVRTDATDVRGSTSRTARATVVVIDSSDPV
jgi:hypothetical protein